MIKWISVKEKLPEEGIWVLVHSKYSYGGKNYHVGYMEKGGISFEIGHCPSDYYGELSCFDITHWGEFPEIDEKNKSVKIEKDILEEMDKKLDSGECERVGMFVRRGKK